MIALTKARWLVFRYINHMIKCINDFYEYVKIIRKNAETMSEYTYTRTYIMASDGHKELKMVLKNCQLSFGLKSDELIKCFQVLKILLKT